MPTIRFSIRTLLVFIGCTAVTLALLTTVSRWIDPFDDSRFDQEKWVSNPSYMRASMARDVLRRVTGANRDSVISLLGEPETRLDAQTNARLQGVEVYTYYVGSGKGGYDDAYVYVHFDSNGAVVHAQITGF